ncbi:MAG: dockerin type I repeat-containing protein, partial [Clostridia bacterium]|nr:dockerin type I repeat-containing protein [Clostridia bacterium]
TEDVNGGFIPRIRVRNRAEIEVTPATSGIQDVNGDGECNFTDALLILRKAMNTGEYPDEWIARMDVDGNGTVNATDALLYLRYVMGVN